MKRLAFVLVLALAAISASAQWYESDSIGLLGDEIDSEQAGEYEYVLHRVVAAGVETRTLYHDGDEVSRTTIERSGTTTLETDYENDEVTATREYDVDGNLTIEILFVGGEPSETRHYEYRGDRLVRRLLLDSDGEQVASERYAYWADGSLRSIIRDSGKLTEYRYVDGLLREEWISQDEQIERTRFDVIGRMVDRSTWLGNETIEHETRSYWAEDADAALQQVTVERGSETTTTEYDQSGRITRHTVTEDGVLVLERTLAYDGQQLVSEIEREGDETREWGYSYVDGELDRTNYSENGRLVEVSIHHPEQSEYDQINEIYRNGEVALRVYLVDEQRVMEEVIRNGQVILTRRFDAEEEQ